MKKIIWVCGIIAGIISISWGLFNEAVLCDKFSMTTLMIFGYAAMILSFSLIFVGIKNYRDNYNNGQITFGKALGIGLLITLIASTVYVVIWMIDFSFFIPDFGDKYQARMITEMKANGASAAQIQKKATEIAAMMKPYNTNFLYRAMFTYMEIAPVGIVMSLIAALVHKKQAKAINVNA